MNELVRSCRECGKEIFWEDFYGLPEKELEYAVFICEDCVEEWGLSTFLGLGNPVLVGELI